MTNPANGLPCWTDLATPDIEAAKSFYANLMGWTYGPTQEDMGGYTQAYKDGKAVAGLLHMQEGMTMSVWSLYFATDDIAKTEQAIAENGGTVMVSGMDVVGLGSMAIAADPTGAVFGLWQPGTFAGGEMFNEVGSLTWEDLRSQDPEAARAFYTSVFGYRHDELPMPSPMDYKTFSYADGDLPLGGMGEMFGAPAGTPSHWTIYLKVEDTPAAEQMIKDAGGAVLSPTMPTPFGRQALVTDPFGGAFNIIDANKS